MPNLLVAMAQIDNIVGDIEGNAERIMNHIEQARTKQFDMIVFPELALPGYPPEDLLFRPGFHQRVSRQLQRIRVAAQDILVVCGHTTDTSRGVYNSVSCFLDGQVLQTYHKQALPNYGVFDEKRYFIPGDAPAVFEHKGFHIALLICEDIWQEAPVMQTMQHNPDIIVSINASPFHKNKYQDRLATIQRQIKQYKVPVMYIHCVGGQDDLVFDGGSMVFDKAAEVVVQAKFFEEEIVSVELEKSGVGCQIKTNDMLLVPDATAMLYDALVVGVRDYVNKNQFPGVIIGLSGGIDSALTLAIAVDALGCDRVEAVAMPSPYSSQLSCDAAKQQAESMSVVFRNIPISNLFQSFLAALQDDFMGVEADITEENLQARIRGVLLMALSNKFGKMLLSTGNKSEYAVGYSTLYGDMCGGYAVLKDVYKTEVYQLSQYRNTLSHVIPEAVIHRAPTAELALNQTDQDTLPSYDILDQIIELYVEKDWGLDAIAAQGFDRALVFDILKRIDRNEYKRRQAPIGVRVSVRAFGRERRYPITSAYGKLRTIENS